MVIKTLSFGQRSLLFAKLSKIAYYNIKQAKKQAEKLGFTEVEFYNKKGAQAYRFMNKSDVVIACRGTEPTQFNDISADLKAMPVVAETVSRVHSGFKAEVDELWPNIMADLMSKQPKQRLWFCGHSLGAAMATIMASRCHYNTKIPNPQELYTYGSPRVGWRGYVVHLGVVHHRWKNNNDIVTTVPYNWMGYKHHGQEHYINAFGNVRNITGWQRVKDKMRGRWFGLRHGQIDAFSDHSIDHYITSLDMFSRGKEFPQHR